MNLQSPLYVTGLTTDGSKSFLIGGIFKMQDQVGFPVDAAYDICRENNLKIDWLESLCDCWLNDCLKFDSFVRQARLLTGIDFEDRFKSVGATVLAMFPKMNQTQNPVDTVCRYILARKRNGRIKLVDFGIKA